MLISLGANPNVRGPDGKTAAMRASERGHVEAMTVLVDSGADMTLKDSMGQGKESKDSKSSACHREIKF